MKHFLLTYIDDLGRLKVTSLNALNERQARVQASRRVRALKGRFVRLTGGGI